MGIGNLGRRRIGGRILWTEKVARNRVFHRRPQSVHLRDDCRRDTELSAVNSRSSGLHFGLVIFVLVKFDLSVVYLTPGALPSCGSMASAGVWLHTRYMRTGSPTTPSSKTFADLQKATGLETPVVFKLELNRVQFETRRFQFRSSPPLGDLGRLVLRVSNWTRFRARPEMILRI